MGKELEVFDAELHEVCSALKRVERLENDGKMTVFLNFQAAIKHLKHIKSEPGQELAMQAQATARRLQAQQMKMTVQ